MEMKETFQYGIGRLPFVTFDKDDASKERTKERIQDFFDDYDIREYGNLWDERYNITTFPRLNDFRGDGYIFIRWSFTQMNLHIFHLVLI